MSDAISPLFSEYYIAYLGSTSRTMLESPELCCWFHKVGIGNHQLKLFRIVNKQFTVTISCLVESECCVFWSNLSIEVPCNSQDVVGWNVVGGIFQFIVYLFWNTSAVLYQVNEVICQADWDIIILRVFT